MKVIEVAEIYKRIAEKEELARQRVIDTPSRLPNGDLNPTAVRYTTQFNERTCFKFMVADAPTIDAVEVVRCKNCAFFTDMGFCAYNHIDANTNRNVWTKTTPDDFCSRGEKK